MPVNLGDDDGFLTVEANGASVTLDIYEAHNTFLALSQKHADANEYNAAVIAWAEAKGFPKLSQKKAVQLVDAVEREIAAVKKADPV
jgi:hypothetical protein